MARKLDPVTLIEELEIIGAKFGIGRGVHLGDTIIGTKGRVAFEAPAAETLLNAHRELEKLVLTGRQQRIKELVANPYGDLVHEGQLLDPVCRDIEALLLVARARHRRCACADAPRGPVRRGRGFALLADGRLARCLRRSGRRVDRHRCAGVFKNCVVAACVPPAC